MPGLDADDQQVERVRDRLADPVAPLGDDADRGSPRGPMIAGRTRDDHEHAAGCGSSPAVRARTPPSGSSTARRDPDRRVEQRREVALEARLHEQGRRLPGVRPRCSARCRAAIARGALTQPSSVPRRMVIGADAMPTARPAAARARAARAPAAPRRTPPRTATTMTPMSAQRMMRHGRYMSTFGDPRHHEVPDDRPSTRRR